jgi:hypothetical protein
MISLSKGSIYEILNTSANRAIFEYARLSTAHYALGRLHDMTLQKELFFRLEIN